MKEYAQADLKVDRLVAQIPDELIIRNRALVVDRSQDQITESEQESIQLGRSVAQPDG